MGRGGGGIDLLPARSHVLPWSIALTIARAPCARTPALADDQKAVLPAALRHDPAYKGLEFFTHGTCAHYKNTAHFYLMKGPGEYVDQHGLSCLNGWGFGNIGVTAIAAAAYFWDLIGRDPQIVSPLAALEMQQFGQVLEGHHWERYGLGLMELPLQRYGEMNGNVSGIKPYEFMVGHNGADCEPDMLPNMPTFPPLCSQFGNSAHAKHVVTSEWLLYASVKSLSLT